MERSFHPSRTSRIPNRVRYKLKAEALAKGSHLRHRHHVASAAPQQDHMRVIDHHAGRGAAHITQRFGQKYLAVETLERRITLEEQHARIAQHGRSGLHLAFLAGQFQLMRRGVVLKLGSGWELIVTRWYGRRVSDSMPAAKRGQRWIGQLHTSRYQLLMDSHQIPLAAVEKLQDLLPVWFGFLRPLQLRYG